MWWMELRRSALKHGITVEAIEHAVEFALHWDDDAYESDPPTVSILGPDLAGNILEVLAETTGKGVLVVFHEMRARPQFLDLLAD